MYDSGLTDTKTPSMRKTSENQGNCNVYRIIRVIGNNFVCSEDANEQEIILRGLGIGFKKNKGDLIPAARVEKIYTLR
ncbi:MAG: CAT RNA binding domain-containing protein, partial [Butyricicoccus sp.]